MALAGGYYRRLGHRSWGASGLFCGDGPFYTTSLGLPGGVSKPAGVCARQHSSAADG